MNDPIVAAIREFRDKHSAEFNYDLDAISLYYKNKHEEFVAKIKNLKVKSKPQV